MRRRTPFSVVAGISIVAVISSKRKLTGSSLNFFEFRFETVEDLVADGLITMHLEKYANDYIQRMADEAVYEHSPYSQYQKATESRRASAARCHNFVPATFRIPHYCDYCRNFMWGLVQQVNLAIPDFVSFLVQ